MNQLVEPDVQVNIEQMFATQERLLAMLEPRMPSIKKRKASMPVDQVTADLLGMLALTELSIHEMGYCPVSRRPGPCADPELHLDCRPYKPTVQTVRYTGNRMEYVTNAAVSLTVCIAAAVVCAIHYPSNGSMLSAFISFLLLVGFVYWFRKSRVSK